MPASMFPGVAAISSKAFRGTPLKQPGIFPEILSGVFPTVVLRMQNVEFYMLFPGVPLGMSRNPRIRPEILSGTFLRMAIFTKFLQQFIQKHSHEFFREVFSSSGKSSSSSIRNSSQILSVIFSGSFSGNSCKCSSGSFSRSYFQNSFMEFLRYFFLIL